MNKISEVVDEFRTVVLGRSNLLDSLIPPLAFLGVNALAGFKTAVILSFSLSLLFTAYRLVRRQALLYTLVGLILTTLTLILTLWLGKERGIFLPSLFINGATFCLCLVSVGLQRPLVAWTSFFARRWPLQWYWHPKVVPAYNEVTLAWAIFFAARLALQLSFFQKNSLVQLALISWLSDWPATVIMLVLSYLYGSIRLQHLKGPSVQEFSEHAQPPWESQRRGF